MGTLLLNRSICHYVLLLSDCSESVSANTSNCSMDGSLICSSYCTDSPCSIFIFIGSLQARWLRKIPALMQSNLPLHLWIHHFLFHPLLNSDILFIFFLNFDFIFFLDSDIFLLAYEFIMILCCCKYCEYDLWKDLVFIHLLFLFFISFPNFLYLTSMFSFMGGSIMLLQFELCVHSCGICNIQYYVEPHKHFLLEHFFHKPCNLQLYVQS
jgi:hypothetical protein